MRRRELLLLLAPLGIALAGLSGSYIVPLDNDAILYAKGPIDDAVSRLQTRIDKGLRRGSPHDVA